MADTENNSLNDLEIQFLQKMKSEGVSREDATGRLLKARSSLGTKRKNELPGFAKKSFSRLAVEAPFAFAKGFKDFIPEVVGAVGEGAKLFGETLGDAAGDVGRLVRGEETKIGGAFRKLGEVSEKTGKSRTQLATEAFKPGVSAVAEQFVAPEGFNQAEFTAKQALSAPFDTALMAAPIVGGIGRAMSATGRLSKLGKLVSAGQKISKVGSAIEPISATVKGAGKIVKTATKQLAPRVLMEKALGITPTQKANFNEIFKATKDTKGKQFYTDVEDFGLKKGLQGTREEMVSQLSKVFEEAKGSKIELFEKVKTRTKNTYGKLLESLEKDFNVLGQEEVLSEIRLYQKQPTLSAVDMERMRFLASETLPTGAFSGAEPIRTKGIQKLIEPLMERLEKLDPTGEIKRLNLEKRLLNDIAGTSGSLLKALKQSSQRVVSRQLFFRGGLATATTAGAGFLGPLAPIIQPVAAAAGVIDLLTNFPQIASRMAQFIQKTKKFPKKLKLSKDVLKVLEKHKKTGSVLPKEAVQVINALMNGVSGE